MINTGIITGCDTNLAVLQHDAVADGRPRAQHAVLQVHALPEGHVVQQHTVDDLAGGANLRGT